MTDYVTYDEVADWPEPGWKISEGRIVWVDETSFYKLPEREDLSKAITFLKPTENGLWRKLGSLKTAK